MRVEMLQHQHDLFGLRRVLVQDLAHELGPISPGSLRSHLGNALASQRFVSHEDVTDPGALVLIVLPSRLAWFDRHGRADLRKPLGIDLVPERPSDGWDRRAACTRPACPPSHRQTRHGFAEGYTTAAFARDKSRVFFNTCRTVSWLTSSTTSSVTKRSASKRRVQWSRPSGGAKPPSAIKWASCSPSRRRGWVRLSERRVSAACSPRSAHTRLTRTSVDVLTSKASLMCASVQPGPLAPWSAFSSTRACSSLRAGSLPVAISAASPGVVLRSSARYTFSWGLLERLKLLLKDRSLPFA